MNFDVSEFCITDDPISQDVADKILHFHILPLQEIRDKIGRAVKVSKRSGYRPVDYEKAHGRSGNSQHCFRTHGAVDLVYDAELLKELKENSPYKRICFYPNNNFIHVDWKGTGRKYYECPSPTGKWKFIKTL